MNIESKNTKHQCTSCGVCASICPADAISMYLDKEGFYRPQVDNDKCIDCSLCSKVCYKYGETVPYLIEEHPEVKLYAAQAKSEALLNEVTSGGIASLLAESLYDDGYRCVGVVYDNGKDIAKHVCAESKDDLELFKGSKYIQSFTYDAFKQALSSELRGEKIAVFGTPCQIYGIDRFLRMRERREDFLLIDIYCHGTPSLHIWQRYAKEVKEIIHKRKFDKVYFRSKVKGWGNFYVLVVVDGVRAFTSNKKKDEFYQLFFSNLMLNDACKDCTLRSSLEYTDIRVGDFWGNCYDNDTKGVSAVSIVTDKAKDTFKKIENEIIKKEHQYSDFLPFQSWGISYEYDANVRKHLFQMLEGGKPLKEIQDFYFRSQPIKQKLKRYARNVVFLFPPKWINSLKKVYHRVLK